MLALALSQAATAFHLGGAARPLSLAIVPSISPQHPAFMMAADSYTSKGELLLEEGLSAQAWRRSLKNPRPSTSRWPTRSTGRPRHAASLARPRATSNTGRSTCESAEPSPAHHGHFCPLLAFSDA